MNSHQKTIEIVKNTPLFFIVGRSRSGTTLLMSLFEAHPNINIPFENPFISILYKDYAHIHNWDQKLLLKLYNDLYSIGWKFNCWGKNDEKLKNDLLECQGNNSYADICKVVMYNYISIFPKEEILILGDKNPMYAFKMKKIIKLFPDASFIHIIRDYRDHLYSMFKVDFLSSIVPEIAFQWNYSAKEVLNYSKKYPGKIISVRYEDLVANTALTMKRLFEFIQVPDHPEVVNFHHYKDKYIQRYSESIINKFFKSLLNPISSVGINTWPSKLTNQDVMICETIAGNYGELFGYQKKYSNPSLQIRLYIIPRVLFIRLYYIYRFIIHKFPPTIKNAIKKIIPELDIIYYKLFNDKRHKI